MFQDNLVQLRKLNDMTQEELAEKVGVTRQSIAKWEAGLSQPDLERARLLAEAFNVTLDDLASFEPARNLGLAPPPRGKYFFGVVTMGDKGQIVIPAQARKVFSLSAGDRLAVLGEENQGLAVLKADDFLALAEAVRAETLQNSRE